MERERLVGLLDEDGEASSLCRSALTAGAEFVVWSDATPADRLLSVYSRRMRALGRSQQPSVGFAEAVANIANCRDPELVIGYVDDRPASGYQFQLFLNSDSTKIIACLGVKGSGSVL